MAGSQLSQLKAALHTSSLSSNSAHRSKKKNGNNSRKNGIDEESRKAKLESIRQSLNKFDVKTTKTKHQVVNAKPLKGSTGRPGLSKQSGIENRRKTLLPQWQDRNHAGAIVDRRFGEDDPTMTPEEKALQRFTFERQRKASRSSLFNLDDNDDIPSGPAGTGELLTHYGKNLDSVRGSLADQEDLFQKSLTVTPAAARHLEDVDEVIKADGTGSQQHRKRSRAEIMEEVMAKSKMYKYERQKNRDEDEEARMALDDDLASIRGLLGAPNRREPTSRDTFVRKAGLPAPEKTGETEETDTSRSGIRELSKGITLVRPTDGGVANDAVDRGLLADLLGEPSDTANTPASSAIQTTFESNQTAGSQGNHLKSHDEDVLRLLPRLPTEVDDTDRYVLGPRDVDGDDAYDRYVRELAFEKRAAPSDRLKTEAEAALEAAEALRKSEAARLKRMTIDEGSMSDDEQDTSYSRRKQSQRQDNVRRAPEGDDLDDDFQDEDSERQARGFGLGDGLDAMGEEDAAKESAQESASEQSPHEDSDSENGSDESSQASTDDLAETEMLADLLHRDTELDGIDSVVSDSMAGRSKAALPQAASVSNELDLPYTFPCPETHAEFLQIIGKKEHQLPVIIERIRTLYHPSLAEGNKTKLAQFLGVLIDHTEHIARQQSGARSLPILAQHCYSLSQMFPLSAAAYFLAKLKTMQRCLLQGLQAGATLQEAHTWPDAGNLAFLRLVGMVWSTSDFSHPVGLAAGLLIGQYLNQCRVRDLKDLTAGLCLISISCQYEAYSRRYVPECLAFLDKHTETVFLGETASVEDVTEKHNTPSINGVSGIVSQNQEPSSATLDITDVFHRKDAGLHRETLCFITLSILEAVFLPQTSLLSFIECFESLSSSLARVASTLPFSPLQKRVVTVQTGLARAIKLSHSSRRPLTLQSHKPVPIPTFIPKFEQGYVPGRKFDPDSARNEESKLKALVKKEKKGAIRELRKDSRFLAGERAKLQAEKDREYKSKIDKITAGLAEERVEEKRFERTKEREKLRDKQKAGGAGGRGGGGARGGASGRGGRGRGRGRGRS